MNALDWRSFLAAWSRAVLVAPDLAAGLPPEVVASGWLGYPGASDALECAESDCVYPGTWFNINYIPVLTSWMSSRYTVHLARRISVAVPSISISCSGPSSWVMRPMLSLS